MLKSLSIRNFILIDKLDVDFGDGFSVLSGETGAGKSILLGALGILLGKRADTAMIRQGCAKMSICGTFELHTVPQELREMLADYDLDLQQEIMIKRNLDTDGKGKIFINDEPVTLKTLRDIGACLLEIHGQFDNQGLLNSATHLRFLDDYGAYKQEFNDMRMAYFEFKNAQAELEELQAKNQFLKTKAEDLQAWISEFEKINPQKDEVEHLEVKRRQLMNAEKILENLNSAHQAINGSDKGVCSALRAAQSAISRLNALVDNAYENIYNIIDTALINAQEAEAEIENASLQISLNPDEINRLESRLFALKNLARKHNCLPDELPELWRQMQEDLHNLSDIDSNILTLEQKAAETKSKYEEKAKIVSGFRYKFAEILSKNVMKELPDLKLEKAVFSVQISPKSPEQYNQDGIDEVRFAAATNPGMPAGALNKIASGGELARFMLALKVNLAATNQIETMIFDEVDTGVGGATAQAVGEKLAALGQKAQVLVVTHSPQVAAQSSNHYKVEKVIENNQACTILRLLNEKEKQEEIARMLSGEQITDEARAAAKVLIGA